MENRKGATGRSSPLPVDYLKMVTEVFTTNFDAGLQALTKLSKSESYFEATGNVFPSEIVLAISLMQKKQMAATTVYASCDFDPTASSPTLEDLLSACVDSAGSLFAQLLDPKNEEQLERVADNSLGALEDVPFQWTEYKSDRFKIFLKIDKSNPNLDKMADQWLAQHDPLAKELAEEEEEQTKELFVTGPRSPKKKSDLH